MELKGNLKSKVKINALLVNLTSGEFKLEFQPEAPGYGPALWDLSRDKQPEAWSKHVANRESFSFPELLGILKEEGIRAEAAAKLWGLTEIEIGD